MADFAQVLSQAKACHQVGQLHEAERLCRQLLAADSSNPEVLYLLGDVCQSLGKLNEGLSWLEQAARWAPHHPDLRHRFGVALAQSGRLDEAVEHLQEAARLRPDSAEIADSLRLTAATRHNDLALLLQEQGRWDDAIAHLRAAVAAMPDYVAGHGNLGNALKQQGLLDEAADCYRRVLELAPQEAQAYNDLGLIAQSQGRLEEAVALYTRAVGLNTSFAEAHSNLGTALLRQGKHELAEASCRRAIELRSDYCEAHCDLAAVLTAQARYEEAIASCSRALQLDPQSCEAHVRLAQVFGEQRNYDAAAAEYREALRINPSYVDALDRYGLLAQVHGRLDEALECFDRMLQFKPNLAMAHFYRANTLKLKRLQSAAIAGYRETLRLDPGCVPAYYNLAVAHNEMQQPDTAIEFCKKGLELDPDSAGLHDTLAVALHMQGRADEAIPVYRRAIELDPTRTLTHCNLIYALNYVPGIAPDELFAEHLEWANRHAEPLTALAPGHANDRAPDRRLRVGYVSAHFCMHAVNYFTQPLLQSHDHTKFEIYCYSDVKGPDDTTSLLRAAADHWRDVGYMTDSELAQVVRDDRIDILVDLAGHIGGNRLLTFARKPAPIQVTYIGYQNTTGMSAMDYRLTDAQADPPGQTDAYYTEKLVRLPRSFFCYRPPDCAPPISGLPARSTGQVTFGSFNSFNKTTPEAFATWMQILKRVPGSRLLVLAFCGEYLERRLKELAAEHGIDPGRVIPCARRPIDQYLPLIQQADVALDPFPFTGHTTTCDSIWMGVPVVMLLGETYASRFGGSVLANVGLEDLMTRSIDQYVETAVALAGNLDRLQQLRRELRPRMAASALLDFKGFTRHVEAAYRQMWHTYCAQRTVVVPAERPPQPNG